MFYAVSRGVEAFLVSKGIRGPQDIPRGFISDLGFSGAFVRGQVT